MMIVGEILNFAAYSFVEGPFVSLLLLSQALIHSLHSHRGGEHSTVYVVCFHSIKQLSLA